MTRYSVVLLVRSISSLQFSCVCLTQNPICGNWFMGTQTATESFPWNFSACYPCTFFLFVCILSCATGLQKYYKSRKKSSVYENTIIAALLSLTTVSAVPLFSSFVLSCATGLPIYYKSRAKSSVYQNTKPCCFEWGNFMFKTPYLLGVRFWLAKLQSIRRQGRKLNLKRFKKIANWELNNDRKM